MKEFLVRVEIQANEYYHVVAETFEEAVDIIKDGDGDFLEDKEERHIGFHLENEKES